jgi:hypothetical protein
MVNIVHQHVKGVQATIIIEISIFVDFNFDVFPSITLFVSNVGVELNYF